MKSLLRYSSRDVVGLFSLTLLSAGLAHLSDRASAILDPFLPTIIAMVDGFSTMVGGLSIENRIVFAQLVFYRAVDGLLLSCLIVSLLLLRHYWATLIAFSLPISVLFVECLRFRMAAVPVTLETAVVVGKSALTAAILAALLLSFGLYCRRRISGSPPRAAVAYSERPRWQRLVLVAAFTTYALLCAYGWYEMESIRAAWIEAREYWENVDI